jgi:CO dehydrogenase maturation factor
MKIAISGKGGVGKSTIAGALALLMSEKGKRVLALDADPDANLAAALGMPSQKQEEIIPVSRQIGLIEERTGARVKQYGQIFKLNPQVSDIADNYAVTHQGVSLLVLGAVEQGGGGCACPESVLIRSLITDLILYKDDCLIMDMEAGIEHLGRATAKGVDMMLIVVEPGQRSIDCANRIMGMCHELGIKETRVIANKITSENDLSFIKTALEGQDPLVSIPFLEEIRTADRSGLSALENLEKGHKELFEQLLTRIETLLIK